MEMKDKCDGVMAEIRWDFERDGMRIKGAQDHDCVNFAKQVLDSMNENWGAGTHILVTSNLTKDEFLEQVKSKYS